MSPWSGSPNTHVTVTTCHTQDAGPTAFSMVEFKETMRTKGQSPPFAGSDTWLLTKTDFMKGSSFL